MVTRIVPKRPDRPAMLVVDERQALIGSVWPVGLAFPARPAIGRVHHAAARRRRRPTRAGHELRRCGNRTARRQADLAVGVARIVRHRACAAAGRHRQRASRRWLAEVAWRAARASRYSGCCHESSRSLATAARAPRPPAMRGRSADRRNRRRVQSAGRDPRAASTIARRCRCRKRPREKCAEGSADGPALRGSRRISLRARSATAAPCRLPRFVRHRRCGAERPWSSQVRDAVAAGGPAVFGVVEMDGCAACIAGAGRDELPRLRRDLGPPDDAAIPHGPAMLGIDKRDVGNSASSSIDRASGFQARPRNCRRQMQRQQSASSNATGPSASSEPSMAASRTSCSRCK